MITSSRKLAKRARRRELAKLARDPVFHTEVIQGVKTLEGFQRKILEAIPHYDRIVIRSCHDMGKTWLMAKIVLWAGSTFKNSTIITTAPTGRQVELLLWTEIRAGYANSRFPLGGEMTTKKWMLEPKKFPKWYAVGFTTQKEAEHGQGQSNSGFQGMHGPYVLVIFDEATGIAPDVWKQLEGLMTSAQVKFIGIGNPTTKSAKFHSCFSDPSYKKIHLSCFDSPNLIANGIKNMDALKAELARLMELSEEDRLKRLDSYKIAQPQLLTTKWVMGRALAWGIDHPLFVSKALGDFPNEEDSCLMPLGVVEAAQRRPALPSPTDRISIGCDVARMGGDKTVITTMRGVVIGKDDVKVMMKRDAVEVSGQVIAQVNDSGEENINRTTITVDETGPGSGVLDILRQYQREHPAWKRVTIRGIQFGEVFKSPRDGSESSVRDRSEHYANKKAEAFVILAQDLKAEIVLPEQSDYYLEELPTILYKYDNKGRYVMEDKPAYKKRTGRGSPDHADSLAIANIGRYDSLGVGTFEASMNDSKTKPIAPSLKSGDQW